MLLNTLKGGFVRLVDTMPATDADRAIVDAARVSYGKGTKASRDDRALIRYLMRHRHTSPFEMVELKFHVRAPIFVARQWFRHRTGSFNEISGRYSVLDDSAWIPTPEEMGLQSVINGQGRTANMDIEFAEAACRELSVATEAAQAAYNKNLGSGVARELARTCLPVSTFTEWVWKVDLHNLMRFIHLRADRHAQPEIQIYARALAKMVEQVAPLAWAAFEEYVSEAHTFSRSEFQAIRNILTPEQVTAITDDLTKRGASAREIAELHEALHTQKLA
jgi:thymidylate synthase (FAD)